jgi:hypothetical protein
VRSSRRYTFGDSDITCEVQLSPTSYGPVLTLWSSGRAPWVLKEAYEMIPFLPGKVTAFGADGKSIGELADAPVEAKTVMIDRGGFGVRIELEKPMKVRRGAKNTVLIQLVDGPTSADQIGLKYRLVPFVGQP